MRDFLVYPIYPLLFTWISTWTELKHILNIVTKWHFPSTSNESIWPQKMPNFMQELKSAILAIS